MLLVKIEGQDNSVVFIQKVNVPGSFSLLYPR